MTRLLLVVLFDLAGCLYVSSSGETDLRQGQFWNCRFVYHGTEYSRAQCGPFGDPHWVIDHFKFPTDPGTVPRCEYSTDLCLYDPTPDEVDAGPR